MTLRNVFTDAEGEKILVYVIRREQWRKRSGKSKNRKGKHMKEWAPSYGMVPTIQRGSSDAAGKCADDTELQLKSLKKILIA